MSLNTPIPIDSLAFFRIMFGLLVSLELTNDILIGEPQHLIEPVFHFSYWGFEWLKPWKEPFLVYLHYALAIVFGVMVSLGLYFRWASVCLFLSYTSLFLMEKTMYVNHTYLYCLLAFVIIFLPAHRAVSLDVLRKPIRQVTHTPAWTLWVLLFQMGVVYFYAGIAKVNVDWLQAVPLKSWVPSRQDALLPAIVLEQKWLPYLMSYGGLLFDLTVTYFLLWKKTRQAAFVVACIFHLSNVSIFGLATFPWFSIMATSLFFAPDFPKKLPLVGCLFRNNNIPPILAKVQNWRKYLIIAYAIIQFLIPLRQFLYKGNTSWTESAHNFSWHMMLRGKSGYLQFFVSDEQQKLHEEVNVFQYITLDQLNDMLGKPDMVLDLAHFLKKVYMEKGYSNVEVRVKSSISFNNRPPQKMYDESVDLGSQQKSLYTHSWILPLKK